MATFDDTGKKINSERFVTPPDYTLFKQLVAETANKMEISDLKSMVVVAAPGKIDRSSGTVIAFGNLSWTNIPLLSDIASIFKNSIGVIVENDANLAALSEALIIKDKYRKVLYVTISTGIGGCLVVNGFIDVNTMDMEPGFMVFEYNDKLRRWQEFGSGKAFYKKFGMNIGEMPDDRQDAWYWLSRNVAIGLISMIANLTPDAIVIGGGGGSHLDKFQDRLNEELKLYKEPLLSIPPVLVAQNPEEAVIYGCYALAKQHEKSNPQ